MTWGAIKGYEGIYAVSDDGQVMSMNFAKSGLPGIMEPTLREGYPSVMFRTEANKRKWFTVHVLVAAAFIGPRPEGLWINHKNGIRHDNRVENLEYCTPSENNKHAFRIGLVDTHGERHSQAKLNDEAILDIRKRLFYGETQVSIAKHYGLCQSTISLVANRKRWSHIASSENGRVVH